MGSNFIVHRLVDRNGSVQCNPVVCESRHLKSESAPFGLNPNLNPPAFMGGNSCSQCFPGMCLESESKSNGFESESGFESDPSLMMNNEKLMHPMCVSLNP